MPAVISRPSSRSDTSRRRRQELPAPATKSVPWYSREGVYFAAVRDVSDDTRKQMATRQCLRAWYAIHEALHDEARRGRTEFIRDRARLGVLENVGVKGLCRYAGGADPKTIRRQLECLVDLGLVKVVRPAVTFELRDGRLHKARGQGRERPLAIMVTVDAERHCRPAKRQVIGQAVRRALAGPRGESAPPSADSYGESLPPSPPVLMGSHSPPSIETYFQKESETPAATVGVGAAVVSTGDAGLTAGQAGRHPPAEAGGQEAAIHEGEGMDFVPALPPPRRRHDAPPAQYRPKRPKAPPKFFQLDEADKAAPPTQIPADEYAARWNREAADQARRNAAWLAERKARGDALKAAEAERPARPASTPSAAEGPSEGTDGAALAALVIDRRRQIRDDAKAVFRDQWRVDHGRPPLAVPPAAAPLDDEAATLAALVHRKRTEMATAAAG